MPHSFRVVALLAAYNEQDIIGQVVPYLISQGVDVYFIDDGSTDETLTIVEPHLHRGVIGIERRPVSVDSRFCWAEILTRKQELAAEIEADWFIHHDADEFRESPWPMLTLRDAIQRVDRRNYNAIDFHLLNFVPTRQAPAGGADVRSAFTSYELPQEWDRLQIKCWKKTPHAVDLVSSGGHQVQFLNRRVFPIPFLLRHYPLRGQDHAERKVFIERKARYSEADRERAWHVQYDAVAPSHDFLQDESILANYDPTEVRIDLALNNRELERARRELAIALAESERLRQQVGDLTECRAHQENRIESLSEALQAERDRASQEVEAFRQRSNELLASASWRITAPLRLIKRLLTGR